MFYEQLMTFFSSVYYQLNNLRSILDNFSFTESTIFTDFFGAIHYVVGDPLYAYLCLLISALVCFGTYKLAVRVFALFGLF